MPVQTGPACLISDDCPLVPMPVRSANCGIETIAGGVNDLYFIPCSETLSETNLLNVAWWTNLKGDSEATPAIPNTLGSIGMGIGSIGKKSQKQKRYHPAGLIKQPCSPGL